MIQQVFRRKETKYILSAEQHQELMEIIEPYLRQDDYFQETNCSLYFDTPDKYLAIHSQEKPLYKEKLRVRSYNVPKLDDTVFLEIKKKYDGIGSKRRVPIKLADFYDYLEQVRAAKGDYKKTMKIILPMEQKKANLQIQAEINYLFWFYHLEPMLYLAYDRTAYHGADDPVFRVTFDKNIRSRTDDLKLEDGDHGEKYFKNNEVVMEVKALDYYPMWFVRAISKLKIYPAKFSKYGKVMRQREGFVT